MTVQHWIPLVLLLFHLNGSFCIEYYTPISTENCDNFTKSITEHIRTPGYPNNYYNDLDCRKVIRAGQEFSIVLKFLIFQLEGSMGCKYDFLEIRDGAYGFSPLIFKGCGSDIRQGQVFESTGQHMWIRFVSDGEISTKGFLATISAKPKTEVLGSSTYYECYKKIENQQSFEFGDNSLSKEFWEYSRANPDRPVHCVWDISVPEPHKIFVRIANYTTSHLTTDCDSNYIEAYDHSTASSDIRRIDCKLPFTGWISGSSRALLHLYSHSSHTLPQFLITGNVYIKAGMYGNCSSESYVNCFDGYCIPISLKCDSQENCGEGYDEDCTLVEKPSKLDSKYIALFIVVIAGCLLLTTIMTISEVIQKQRDARKERLEKRESAKVIINLGSQSSSLLSNNNVKAHRNVQTLRSKGYCSSTTADSFIGTFRSSRFNENVSFRKGDPPNQSTSRELNEDRPYQAPHSITLPPQSVKVELPHAPPLSHAGPPSPLTPPPPPAPSQEGKGFRLIYDLTNLGKGGTGAFEYPPPPSFLQADSDDDFEESSTIAEFVSTSSSSFASSPPELSYDVACLERKRSKPAPNAVKLTEIPSEATKLLSPVLNRKFRSEAPKYSPPQAPGSTKRSWTFDDNKEDDDSIELTTYISTC